MSCRESAIHTAQRVIDLYAQHLSAGDDPLYQTLIDHGDHAEVIVRYLTQHDELVKQRDELVSALQACEAVLHPGAVGLIMAEHGQEAGDRAIAAVYAIRAALAKVPGAPSC